MLFKDIPGYKGLYFVSDNGGVWSYHQRGSKAGKTIAIPKVIKQRLQNSGYLFVTLYKRTKSKNMLVHRLVANAFVDNPKRHKYVNHRDGDKKNNSASNLSWVSFSENMKHAWDNGLLKNTPAKTAHAKKLGLSNRKHEWGIIKEIRESYKTGVLQKDLAKKYGMDFREISSIVRYKTYREQA